MILSQIGKPIDQPKAATSQLILEDGYKLENVSKNVESIIDTWLGDISSITQGVIKGKYPTF
jgi:S-adenosylmethionine synthetase